MADKYTDTIAASNVITDDAAVADAVAAILADHLEENRNADVYKKIFNSIDLTTLKTTDSQQSVAKFTERVNSFEEDYGDLPPVAAICVYPNFVPVVRTTLDVSSVGVAAVAGAFPTSQSFIEVKVAEIGLAVEAGADEIVDDIERRISELFAEKLSAGSQVITIADVEEVIARMGKPEDMEAEGESASADSGSTSAGGGYGAGAWNSNTAYGTTRRRLYRNPDDKMLGGVISGMAAYLGWDVTLLRLLLLVILICGVGTLIPVYIVCWLVIPEARTAAEKLSMRGEAVTVENIGKTVTDGFEKVANGVNDYMRSDKPRTFLQKLGDALVMIVGWFLKICLVIFAIICSPVLFVFGVVFVALLFAAIAVAVGGGAALISFFPMADVVLPTSPLSAIVMYIAGILLVGIPLVSLVWAIFSQIFKWQPMNSGLKWTLVILWIVSAACFGICFAVQGATFPELGIFNF